MTKLDEWKRMKLKRLPNSTLKEMSSSYEIQGENNALTFIYEKPKVVADWKAKRKLMNEPSCI